MGIVQIPFYPKSESSKPLKECISTAARELAMSEHDVVLAMTYFFDELAIQVARGRVVRIPGFGIFASKWFATSKSSAPRFSASRGFRLQTRFSSPRIDDNSRALKRYTKRAGDSSRGVSQRVFTSNNADRASIKKQLMGL